MKLVLPLMYAGCVGLRREKAWRVYSLVLKNRLPFRSVFRKMCACPTFALNREIAIVQMLLVTTSNALAVVKQCFSANLDFRLFVKRHDSFCFRDWLF